MLTAVAGLLNPEHQLQWVVNVPPPDFAIQQEAPRHVVLTGDGGIIVLSNYAADTGGGINWSSFAVRLASDGSEEWRTVFLGCGVGEGIAVAPSGNVVVAGRFKDRVTIVGQTLEARSPGEHSFVAELDPAGQPVGIRPLQIPADIDSDEIVSSPRSMTMIGDNLLVGGLYYTVSDENPEQRNGHYVSANRLDGEVVSGLLFPVNTSEERWPLGPVTAAARPDGGLALGGDFTGRVDFGDGEVFSGLESGRHPRLVPFFVVLNPRPGEAEVELIDVRAARAAPAPRR